MLEKEKEDHQKEKGKEGARSFMGSVHRIRLSGGGDFVGVGVGGPPACIPPLPTSLPPSLSCASQVSLKIPSSMATPNTASGQRSTSSHTSSADLRGEASLSLPVVAVTVPVVLLLPLLLLHLLNLIQVPVIHVLHPYHHLPTNVIKIKF